MGCKWIYKVKKGVPSVKPQRYKARLVAKGFTQKKKRLISQRCFLQWSNTYP